MIVGLAGHVDHGKTLLIRALTGVDTDRLPEERARGMTIDLGFAYAERPEGVVGFVDVPGHERFLSNMLAGVLAMDRVLLVVAADDGPMPQTLEHLEVLRLVGVAGLAVAVTKTDRVPAARVEAVAGEMAALVARAGYAAPPVHRVSSVTGEGLAALWRWIDAEPPMARGDAGGFRMSIDRSFVLPGVGPVVTGTVAAGEVRVGDTLLLSPARLAARVRSLRVQDRPAELARAGDRCALAISGARIERARLRRGDWLVAPGLHAPTDRVDARVRLADGRTLRHGGMVHAHLGAAALPARLTVWDEDEAGAFVRLQFARAAPALHGDRLVLRDDGSGRIVAGGHVVDPFPPARRRPRPHRVAELVALAAPGAGDALGGLVAANGWADLSALARARNLDGAALERLARGVTLLGPAGRRIAISAQARAAVRERLLAMLARHHAAHPDLGGAARSAVLAAAGTEPAIAEAMLAELLAERAVVPEGLVLRLPEHRPRLPEQDEAAWPAVAALLSGGGLRPPRVREVAEALALEPDAAEALLVRYERFGRVLRVAPNRFFLPQTLAALAHAAATLAEPDGFTAADYNRSTGLGRNVAIEVLEFLDRIGVTRRTGELRHLVGEPGDIVV